MIHNKTLTKFVILLAGVFLLTSCGPVHRFTRVKKVPRQYSLNYCGGEEIKAPKTELNKEPWVVFSDREKNASYNRPGGKVKAKEVDFLDPFLVIKKREDFLEVIKYAPNILKNGKLDYKNAEYYGWMHASTLLLNRRSVTDIASGQKNKMLITLSDTAFLEKPELYFRNDSALTYRGSLSETPAKGTVLYGIVYPLKEAEKEGKVLISVTPEVDPDNAKEEIAGWIDRSLVCDIGQGLHVKAASIADSLIRFPLQNGNTPGFAGDIADANEFLSSRYPVTKYAPATSFSTRDTLVAFRTHMALPVFDNSDNYVFNVNGGHIRYNDFKTIARNLKRINLIFVIQGKEHTIAQFPKLINAIQTLQPLFENPGDPCSYRFGCVLTFDDASASVPASMNLTGNYSEIVNFLMNKADKKEKLRPLNISRTWAGVHTAADLCAPHKEESNLLVVIGESAGATETKDSLLNKKLAEYNCRILGFQPYAPQGEASTNFVLDIATMIDSYAGALKRIKGDRLVSPKQVKNTSYYMEIGEARNGYRLDFPENSITQGGILFPQKGEYLPMDVLTNNVDTIIRQIKEDNDDMLRHILHAFNTVGSNRTKYDSLFIQHFGLELSRLESSRIPPKKLLDNLKNESPGWLLSSAPVFMSGSGHKATGYRLLVSEQEMEDLKDFVDALSSEEAELMQKGPRKKTGEKPCNCEEDLFEELASKQELPVYDDGIDSTRMQRYYENTLYIRTYLKRFYMATVRYCKLCKPGRGITASMTLAEAQRRITGIPTSTEVLNRLRINDLHNYKLLTDENLDELVTYFKSKIGALDEAEKIESNGQLYYWVSQDLLP